MQNLLRLVYEKILLLSSVNSWGDYQAIEALLPGDLKKEQIKAG
jgi:hypothetical protein